MSIYNLYNNLVDSGKYSIVPSSNYQQNLENNIKQNYSGANYFRNSTSEMAKDYINRAETPTGKALMNVAMAAGAVPVGAASLLYDAYQALNRYDKAPAPEIGLDSIVPENMYRGKTNFIDTYKKEQPITAAYNRAKGMVDPLAESLGQELSNFNLKNTLSNIFSTKANASEALDEVPYSELDDFEAQNAGQFVPEEGKGIGELLQNLSGGVVNFGKDILGRQIASQALSGAGAMINPYLGLAGGITGLLGGGDLFNTNSLSQRRFDAMTPGQQAYTSSLYNPGGLLEGYNEISAFGQGALGTLGNRLSTVQNTLAKQGANKSAFLQQREKQIKDAIDKSINIGESEALGSDDTSVDYGITGGRTRTDIDVADGGAETSGGKIVCTMMNESYGFGNFRNKIWLKHSKNLPKEYEIGYHKIFLPLVKFAKRKGKLNKMVKKTLEHVARHRTLDLKQEMKGKTHILGRVYRKILEPICFIIGKVSNND
jgi:hypothetical protein